MSIIFLSDVHLRLDRPERGRRLARVVDSLASTDRLVIVGDLCDFWFASRQTSDLRLCEGLQSLANFRDRGGTLILLPGNHDTWLGPYYESKLGVGYDNSIFRETIGGIRFHAEHGHEACRQSLLKRGLKSRFFVRAFAAIPKPVARIMGGMLDASNSVTRTSTDQKHLSVYRQCADLLAESADICIYGHIHIAHDDLANRPRMIVLGGWHHRSSFLRVDDSGRAELIIVLS